jgi:hypothetical protein
VENIAYFCWIILEQFAFETEVLSKGDTAFLALLSRILLFLAVQTTQVYDFFEFHTLHLTSFLVLELSVMAELAWVVDEATRSFDKA